MKHMIATCPGMMQPLEDLMGRKVDLAKIRAYVLLRQSMLSSEDRKRVIMENEGIP